MSRDGVNGYIPGTVTAERVARQKSGAGGLGERFFFMLSGLIYQTGLALVQTDSSHSVDGAPLEVKRCEHFSQLKNVNNF